MACFVASEILAKHDETYMPREVMEALKEQGEWRGPDGQDDRKPDAAACYPKCGGRISICDTACGNRLDRGRGDCDSTGLADKVAHAFHPPAPERLQKLCRPDRS